MFFPITRRHFVAGTASAGALAALGETQNGSRIRPRPNHRTSERNPVSIAAKPLDYRHLRQRRGADKASVGRARDHPRALNIAQHVTQPRAISGGYTERAGDFARSDCGGALADKIE